MIKSFLRLWLATFLILVASAVLLLSDRERRAAGRRRRGRARARPGGSARSRCSSTSRRRRSRRGSAACWPGWRHRDSRRAGRSGVRRYNAEGDAATSNTIARAIVGGDDELIITLSTPSLQAVAGANRDAKAPARLRDGERPCRGRRRHLAGRPDEAPALHGRHRDDAAGGRDVPDGPAARPSTGEGRRRLEPVGGELRSRHEARPDGLQGAGNRAAGGERRWLRGRPRGGRRARRPGGRGDLGRGRQRWCSPRSTP